MTSETPTTNWRHWPWQVHKLLWLLKKLSPFKMQDCTKLVDYCIDLCNFRQRTDTARPTSPMGRDQDSCSSLREVTWCGQCSSWAAWSGEKETATLLHVKESGNTKNGQKNRNTKQYQICRTISLISYPSKAMLRVVHLLQKELLAEELAGFSPGRSSVEQIFNHLILIQKHVQYQLHFFHNFTDFKKAFYSVCHEGLWCDLKIQHWGGSCLSCQSTVH